MATVKVVCSSAAEGTTLAAPAETVGTAALAAGTVRVTTWVEVGMSSVEVVDWFRSGQLVTEGAHERTVWMLVL